MSVFRFVSRLTAVQLRSAGGCQICGAPIALCAVDRQTERSLARWTVRTHRTCWTVHMIGHFGRVDRWTVPTPFLYFLSLFLYCRESKKESKTVQPSSLAPPICSMRRGGSRRVVGATACWPAARGD